MLEIDNLTVQYQTDDGPIVAVDDVSLSVESDEIVGIVGESGCGKSTLLKAIQRILSENAAVPSGEIRVDGTDILDLPLPEFRSEYALQQVSTIPQASMDSLDPIFTIRSQLAESIRVHEDDVSKAEIDERIHERIAEMGLDESVIDKYPHELSGGQVQRILIANSFILEPTTVLADEPTTGLDLLTKTRILKWLKRHQRQNNFGLLLISHDLPLVAQMSDKLGVMYSGQLIEYGDAEELFNNPSHPYTKGLIDSTMHIGKDEASSHIPGSPPTIREGHEGCKFESRCPYRFEDCSQTPELDETEGHHVACHLSTEEMEAMRKEPQDVYAK
ncbi:ABC transporter ATP-binding protein [Haloferax sp. YSMS24]|uniref:ABC transporter ATP-binding protein n=1 Tax=unclassified Haloferax TaxID=2625095 RepID=UPI00398CB152